MPKQAGNKLIAKNAVMLYMRMFITMLISFFTTRVVLQALGASDYGIYNLVGGVIVLINTITTALNSSTSRFLTFSLGKDDEQRLKVVFSTAFYVHFLLAFIFVLVAESIGLWFVNTKLIIPEERMVAANWVFQAAVISTALGITQTPYDASISSHERMGALAYIAIVNSVLKLAIAYIVIFSQVDHLILYSILYMLLAVCFRLYYRYYCICYFKECRITKSFDRILAKKMLSFSGWSLLGGGMLTVSQQGTNILLNRFFGTLLNAAAGVAIQVQGILSAFMGNIPIAFRPQIVKEYACGNYSRVSELITLGTKFTATAAMITTLPVIFNMEKLMNLWLHSVPQGSVIICQILLIRNVFVCFNLFLNYAISASGKIKGINMFYSFIYVSMLFLLWVVLKMSHSYTIMYIVGSLDSICSVFIYLYFIKKVMPMFKCRNYLLHTYVPILLIGIFTGGLLFIISKVISSSFLYFMISIVVSIMTVSLLVYLLVLDKYSRNIIKLFIQEQIGKK